MFRHGVRDHAGTFILDSKNVTLSNLKYRHTSGLGVLSQYSENLAFKDHVISPSESFRSWRGNREGITLIACDHLVVEGNDVDRDFVGKGVKIEGGQPEKFRIDWPK